MRKTSKLIIFGFLTIIIVFMFFLIMPIRTPKTMERLAKRELNYTLSESFRNLDRDRLQGPIVHQTAKGLCFQWYVPLEWGDSASFYIDVAKYPFTSGLREYLFRYTRMNYQTKYLQYPNGLGHFVDIQPYRMQSDTALLAKFSFDKSQQSDTIDGSYHLIVKKQKLYYLLEKGFFRTARKTNEYSVVEFFEPIGWKYVNEKNKGINSTYKQYTEKARIEITDNFLVQINLVDR